MLLSLQKKRKFFWLGNIFSSFFLLCGCASSPVPNNTSPEIMEQTTENTIDDNKIASQRIKEEYEKLQQKRHCTAA